MAPWVAAQPGLAKFTGVVDLLGGLGMLLPALLRIQPRLSVLAAVGIIALQVLAMGFHLMRARSWPPAPPGMSFRHPRSSPRAFKPIACRPDP